jgi:cyclophilin family peptidyl-prolyl cis-trans isomerase
MDKDTKITFAVIGVLVLFLAGLAYVLRANVTIPPVATNTEKIVPKKSSTGTGASALRATSTDQLATSTKATTTMQLPEKITSAIITTNQGVIEITFTSDSPKAVKNFAKLASEGFYNGIRFHRVIQAGDPFSKDSGMRSRWGTGGPGYTFEDEIHPGDTYKRGTLAMANAGPNTNGSQFFIVTGEDVTKDIGPLYTVFGHVTKGIETAMKIEATQTDGENKPLADMLIEKVEIK